MRFFSFAMLMMLLVDSAVADTVVPTRTIRANSIISGADIGLSNGSTENSFARLQDVIGQEARVTLYTGRAIRVDDIGPPAVVARNQIVQLRFEANGLMILTEGRALQRGGVGDQVRVMNLASRNTLFGQVQPDGTIRVLN